MSLRSFGRLVTCRSDGVPEFCAAQEVAQRGLESLFNVRLNILQNVLLSYSGTLDRGSHRRYLLRRPAPPVFNHNVQIDFSVILVAESGSQPKVKDVNRPN